MGLALLKGPSMGMISLAAPSERTTHVGNSNPSPRFPPMVRLARRIGGPKANAEALGAAIVMIPLVLIGLWLSWGTPWTLWGFLMSVYYLVLPIATFLISRRSRDTRPRLPRIRWLFALFWAAAFLFWYPSLGGGMFIADLTHAATALLGAAVVWGFLEGFAVRAPGGAS